jgi:hypothetical protein
MSAELRSTLPKPADRLRLGEVFDVSPFCLGMVRDWRTVPAAFEAGINFFFVSADMHWPLYEGLRRGLADLLARGGGVRDSLVVAAVSYVAQPEFCYIPFKEVIDSVPGLVRLDVTVAGAAAAHDFPVRAAEYRRHADWGVRLFGATFHDRAFAADTIAAGNVKIGFIRYNPFHRGAEEEVFPRIVGGVPARVYNFNSMQKLSEVQYAALKLPEGYWRPAPSEYYRYALVRPELDGILFAPQTPEELRDSLDGVARGPLTEEEHAYLGDLADLAKGEAELDDDVRAT